MISLEFTLSVSKCLSCHFCPMDKFTSAYKSDIRIMTMSTVRAILEKLPMDCTCDLSGFSEPTLNHLFAEIVKAMSDTGREVRIFTTLAGLTEHQLFDLSRSRISYIRLHLPDATGLKIKAEVWLKKFRLFLQANQPFTCMAMSYEVDPQIVAEVERTGVKIEFPEMLGRAGNLWTPKDKPLKGHIRCAANRWHNNILLPSGDVVACCQDWNLSMPLGNLLTQPYSEIEAKANEYEANTNPPDDAACRFCEWCAPL